MLGGPAAGNVRAMDAGSDPIRALGLVKRYGKLVAVDCISFRARQGTCLGLLGPNGAGKTTTIEILEGLLVPDAGEVKILGQTWASGGRRLRESIGVQLQETKLHEKLTVLETLSLFASLYKNRREPRDVATLVGLTEKHKARVGELSGGQKQRLALGCALIHRPEILFLDEPTTGLDPQARRLVWEIVEEFKHGGGTVLLTTHYMEEAERLADDLVIIDSGKVIAEGAPAALIRTLGADRLIEYELPERHERELSPSEVERLKRLPGVVDVRSFAGTVSLTATDAQAALGALVEEARNGHSEIRDLRVHRTTLEDVFVSLTGKHLRDD